jgi:gamma-glutamylputrescine oxidase
MPSDPVWEDGDWQPLPTLSADAAADACVIGLGGSGLACVHELLDLGLSVMAIDAAQVAAAAAGRNGGFLLAGSCHFHHDAVTRFGRERATEIYRLTLSQIERIEQETPAAVRRTGSLRLAASPAELDDCQRQLRAMRDDALPVESFEAAHGAGLLFPNDAAFNPLLRCRLLARSAIRRGAILFENSAATAVQQGVVTTRNARISCDHVFVAVDGGLPALLPELAGTVRIARLQMLATAPAPEVHFPRPVYSRFGFEYWQQLPDGRIALGGFRDLSADEWTTSTETSEAVQDALERHLRVVLGVRAPIERRWAASVGYTGDGLPVFQEPRLGVHAFGAYSGTGNVIGALCGRAAARLAVRGDVSLARPFISTAPQRRRPAADDGPQPPALTT